MKQEEFGFALKRDFVPSLKRSSPFFWVEEIRVYKTYSPDAEQCKYQLQRGLNILWAEPGNDKVELYKKGIKGHAAGKTTFCRLLRYLLGEQTFGTTGFRDSLLKWSANAFVVGKIWVNNESWIVSKTLGVNDKHDMAFLGDRIEQIFTPPAGCRKPIDFSDMLGKEIVKPMTAKKLPYGSQLSWRYLLPWLTRDQECRLSHLLTWRDPSTESNRPDMSVADACYIVRSVMDLITESEETAIENHKKIQKRAKDLDQELPLLKHEVKKGIESILPYASEKSLVAPFLFEDIKQTLNRKITQLQDDSKLATLREQYKKCRDQYEAENSNVIAFEANFTNQKSMFALDEKAHRAKAGKHAQENADTEIEDEKPAPLGRCNVLLSFARLRCPLAKERQSDFESHKNLMTAAETVRAEKEGLEAARKAINDIRIELMRMKLNLKQLEKRSASAQSAYEKHRDVLNQSIGMYQQILKDVDVISLKFNNLQTSEAEQKSLQTKIRDSNADQETIRKREDQKRTRVNELFDDLIKAVLGENMSASFTANAQTIELKVDCDGERISAATETIKILSFDIAAMLLSAEGYGNHPRFLIHDSPREADMQKDIYQRFFLYMRELEKKVPKSGPNFQYIITTTEPPPEELQKKPWLIAKLDASKAEGRILRVNL